ncbi:hypothetical protein E5161_15010 [Cohnella pontilimi]|uniref:Uncharacterized protein n=1 Tax=Cohnella pontilimi TaxID=2564100 RepID=A0A4U0F8L1_9BACL|nr:hypothetical protein [Cohnella pontilimi]TJY41017.1 hypothetical protein E5161_15010 [Cohnella pontilimi]
MAVVVCPWCQSEIPHEEGEEPEKYCPVCENEIGGYRTLTFGIDDSEDEDEEPAAQFTGTEAEDLRLGGSNEALLRFEETVERVLDEQETVPECPQCREYMLEAGELAVPAAFFRPRTPEALGKAVLEAPFSITLYVCPSCFTVQQSLAEQGRLDLARRLSGTENL